MWQWHSVAVGKQHGTSWADEILFLGGVYLAVDYDISQEECDTVGLKATNVDQKGGDLRLVLLAFFEGV